MRGENHRSLIQVVFGNFINFVIKREGLRVGIIVNVDFQDQIESEEMIYN